MAEKISWALAAVICIGLPLLTDEPGLALAGAAALAVLAWRLRHSKADDEH